MADKERDRKHYALTEESKYYVDIIASAMERTIKRLWIVIIILIVLIAAMATERIWLQSQITTESIEQEVTQKTGDGNNQFVGGDYYGYTND